MEEKKERIRKDYRIKDGITQKLMTFRADIETLEILTSVANKGRLINRLVQEWARSRNADESETDEDPAWRQREDTQA